eukprot:5592820-Pyramimonas_sp.AAC.4
MRTDKSARPRCAADPGTSTCAQSAPCTIARPIPGHHADRQVSTSTLRGRPTNIAICPISSLHHCQANPRPPCGQTGGPPVNGARRRKDPPIVHRWNPSQSAGTLMLNIDS